MKKDYYKILGLEKNASAADVSKAYRKLAMKYHPDRNPTNSEEANDKFKEVQEAYEVLNDSNKRRMYDSGVDPRDGRVGDGFGVNPFDIFSELFGRQQHFNYERRKQSQHFSDLKSHVSISLKEAYNGCSKKVQTSYLKECESCNGLGGSNKDTCVGCNGLGRQYIKQGFFTVESTCTKCYGEGYVIVNKCKKCNGQGYAEEVTEEIKVKIPKGVSTGSVITLKGKGKFRDKSDLHIIINVDEHEFYHRDDVGNLKCSIPITYSEAVLGCEKEIPLLSGKKCCIKIPPGIKSGNLLRVLYEGMTFEKRSGHLYVEVIIEPTINSDPEYLEILNKLQKFEKENRVFKDFKDKLNRI